jgi:unsaturated rhamnogalacturonyl hydrolase
MKSSFSRETEKGFTLIELLVVIRNGWAALTARIEADGTVHDICAGTMCTEDEEYCANRPFYDNDTHGLFAVLFAAMEVNRLGGLAELDERS